MIKTVVILGAGWAGLPLAHKLLKYTVPNILAGLNVILVSPNSHFYWNVAATRGVIPGAIPDDQLFLSIEEGFARYSPANFEFVLGNAEGIDLERNRVTVALNGGTQRLVSYDHLVIATGSRIQSSLPFKPVGAHEETLAALHSLQGEIEAAKSIVVAGAGPTGVETVGEIAAAYRGEKEMTLIISGERALQSSEVRVDVSLGVEKDLQKLGVKLVRNVQVKEVQASEEEKAGSGSRTTLKLSSQYSFLSTIDLSTPVNACYNLINPNTDTDSASNADGATILADLYLPLFGVKVNTSFVPQSLLDDAGNLNLEKTMRVSGTQNVWGIGDVGNIEAKQLTVTDAQIIYLSNVLDSVLTEKEDHVKDYKPSPKTMVFVSLGKKFAIGQIGDWRLWGWMVSYVKGRKLFVDTAQGYVSGKRLRHASM